MRPLSVQVYVKDDDEEEEEEEEEYKEDNCVLRLPDGTVHTVAGLESPSHARTPLPTITEQVNTDLNCIIYLYCKVYIYYHMSYIEAGSKWGSRQRERLTSETFRQA